jgi:hypothetical protein
VRVEVSRDRYRRVAQALGDNLDVHAWPPHWRSSLPGSAPTSPRARRPARADPRTRPTAAPEQDPQKTPGSGHRKPARCCEMLSLTRCHLPGQPIVVW